MWQIFTNVYVHYRKYFLKRGTLCSKWGIESKYCGRIHENFKNVFRLTKTSSICLIWQLKVQRSFNMIVIAKNKVGSSQLQADLIFRCLLLCFHSSL